MRLSFITQFKIEFLIPFTGCRKVLGKMPVLGFLGPVIFQLSIFASVIVLITLSVFFPMCY